MQICDTNILMHANDTNNTNSYPLVSLSTICILVLCKSFLVAPIRLLRKPLTDADFTRTYAEKILRSSAFVLRKSAVERSSKIKNQVSRVKII